MHCEEVFTKIFTAAENVANLLAIKITRPRIRVVNGPTSSCPNPAQTQKYKPEPGPKPNLNLKSCPKKTKVKLDLKNLAKLPRYFDYIFVHLRKKARFKPKLSPKFLSTLGPNPNPTQKARPDLQLCLELLKPPSIEEIVEQRISLLKAVTG